MNFATSADKCCKSWAKDNWKYTHRVFALSRPDAVLKAALFVCIVGLTWRCGGVHKLLLWRDVVQAGAHTWAKGGNRKNNTKQAAVSLPAPSATRMFLWPSEILHQSSWDRSFLNPLINKLFMPLQIIWLTPGSWWCNPGCRRTRWTDLSSWWCGQPSAWQSPGCGARRRSPCRRGSSQT